ncbi:MAG: ABC transporter substrate-binding protein [Candidatus Rokubacteria bacterium]|nr:ABC transporter substrate-binding protein [Candidatus Rokubacteria bacterium]
MNRTRRAFRVLRVLAAVLVAGTAWTAVPAGPAVAQVKALRVGVANSYTGVAIPYTIPEKEAMLLAVEEINAAGGVLGRPLELAFRDDKLRPDLGLTNLQELVYQEKVELILGPFSSGVSLAFADWAKQHKRLFIATIAATHRLTNEFWNPYVFRVNQHVFFTGRALARVAAKLPHKRYAVIGQDYEGGRVPWDAFLEVLKKEKPGVEVVSQQFPKLGETDFTPYITATLAARPEAVFVTLFGTGFQQFVLQAKPYGFFDKVQLIGPYSGRPDDHRGLGAEAPEGMLLNGYPWSADIAPFSSPPHREFVDKIRKRTGNWPVWGSITGYIAVKAAAAGVTKAGTTDNEKVIKALEKLPIDTPLGRMHFRDFDHQLTIPAWIGWSKVDPKIGEMTLTRIQEIPAEQGLQTKEEILEIRAKAKK